MRIINNYNNTRNFDMTDKTETTLISKFISKLKEGNAIDAMANLKEVIDLKVKQKHEKASKEID